VIHDQANGYGGIYFADVQRGCAESTAAGGAVTAGFYQIPITPGQVQNDSTKRGMGLCWFTWVRTFSPGLVLTVSPFYHYNNVNMGVARLTTEFGDGDASRRIMKEGRRICRGLRNATICGPAFYGFAEQASQLFGLVCNVPTECNNVNPPVTTSPTGGLAAAYVEDQIKLTSWLSVDGGIRQTHYSAEVVEKASSPRVGASLRIPKLNWVFRAFYGHFIRRRRSRRFPGRCWTGRDQPESGIHSAATRRARRGASVRRQPFPYGDGRSMLYFLTRAKNYFDHNNFNNSNLFFPITIQGARISGWELTVRSPQIRKRAQGVSDVFEPACARLRQH